MPKQRTVTHPERYYSLDTNTYYKNATLATLKDSFAKLQNLAETTHDEEYQLSLELFIYSKEYYENLVNIDTIEYRLLQLSSEAANENLLRLDADAAELLGDIYAKNGNQSLVIEQYFSAYGNYKNLSEVEFPAKQDYLYKLGILYYKYQEYGNALIYLLEAYHLNQPARDNVFSSIVNTVGLCYRNMNKYDSAILFFQIVRDAALKKGERVWESIAEGNIGITYFLQKKYTEAIPLLKNNIDFGLSHLNKKDAVNSMIVLATIYNEQGKNEESEKLLLTALSYCHNRTFWSDFALAERLYEQLYRLYRAKKIYTLSYLYADSAMIAKDSSLSRVNALTLSESYEKENYIKKRLETEKLRSQATAQQAQNFNQQQLLYKFIIGFLIVVMIIAALINRNRNFLKNRATSAGDAPEIIIQKMSIVIISIATCAGALIWASLYYYYYGLCLATLGPVIYLCVIGPALAIYFLLKRQQFLVNVQLICIFVMPIMMEWANGGYQSGVVINWSLLAPVGALMYKGVREAAFWMIMLVLAVICTIIFNSYFYTHYHHISEIGQSMFYGMDILAPSIIIYFSMQFYVKSVIRDGRLLNENNLLLSNALGELKVEKQKSDELLHSVNLQKEELEQKNTEISELVTEREKTIEIRTAELRVANLKLVELIQYNAHNIREPLTRILGVLTMREYVSDSDFIENYLPMMGKSVYDLDKTIKQVISDLEETVEPKK